jgi:hypothetical protein
MCLATEFGIYHVAVDEMFYSLYNIRPLTLKRLISSQIFSTQQLQHLQDEHCPLHIQNQTM